MKTIVRPTLAAALILVIAACASPSGQPWTPPPSAAETETPASQAPASEAPASVAPASVPPASEVPASQAPASVQPSLAPTAGSSSEPTARVIDLELTAALQIMSGGVQVKDIPVTPGETIVFRITNTAGYAHNFWIGRDSALLTGVTTGLTGIADWTDAEPRELTWVVPENATDLKFGCTVPGHYTSMNGTFSAAGGAPASQGPASQAPALMEPSIAPSVAPSVAPSAGTSAEPEGRVLELEMNAALQILSGGTQIKDIPVTPGETITFKLTNTAGYAHNFWIGPDAALMANQTTGLTGIPDWTDAEPRELTWVVPDDATSLKFGCTFPGHYMLMNGTFSTTQ